jgi:arrestin-related trafficking adapter 3/6
VLNKSEGNYNYPISFTFPSDLPASIEAEFSSVRYKLKAIVHRSGTFSAKITATTNVELVSAPAEEDAEEDDSVVVERQWDTELRYTVSITGRNFPQGSDVSTWLFCFLLNLTPRKIPWSVQLMPLSKSKLHRMTFVLEGRLITP